MTLNRKIAAELDVLTAPAVDRPGRMDVTEGPHRVEMTIREAGPVGLALDQLTYTRSDRPEWTTDALRAWGDRLSARLTYLLEPLVVLEVDAEAGEVELRSARPSKREGARSYYQVGLRKEGRLDFQRFRFEEADRSRHPVPCQFTREVLERLVDDLAASSA
jgi:hypothetical protein